MMTRTLTLLLLMLALPASAEEPPVSLPSVEDNIHAMDRDRDGMVSVSEIRAFLEARHGKDYEHKLLDDMEAKAGSKSCSSPFSRSFY